MDAKKEIEGENHVEIVGGTGGVHVTLQGGGAEDPAPIRSRGCPVATVMRSSRAMVVSLHLGTLDVPQLGIPSLWRDVGDGDGGCSHGPYGFLVLTWGVAQVREHMIGQADRVWHSSCRWGDTVQFEAVSPAMQVDSSM